MARGAGQRGQQLRGRHALSICFHTSCAKGMQHAAKTVRVTAGPRGGGRGERRGGGGRGRGRGGGGTKTKTRRPRTFSFSPAMDEPCFIKPPPEGAALPRLVCYDLDDTVWFPELYMMCGAPWSKDELGRVTDTCGTELRVYPAASESIRMILDPDGPFQSSGVGAEVAFASRTNRGKWAMEALDLLRLDEGTSLREAVGDLVEIFPGTKRKHFEALRNKSGVPYSQMLFFDNERINVEEVGQLGVTSIYCPGGMSQGAWEKGLETYARNARQRSAAARR